jgi:hypothetical protein
MPTLISRLNFTALVTMALSSQAFSAPNQATQLPHLDLEMTGREYQPLVSDLINTEDVSSPQLRAILRIGKRNLEWLDHINSLRDVTNQLELSTADTQIGYPIDAPTLNNESLVLQSYTEWLTTTPESISGVLTSEVIYPDVPPTADENFLTTAREIDRIYQRASRWLLQVSYLEEYKLEKKNDIRGYYYLSREIELQSKLNNWNQLSAAERQRLQPLLVGQCFNKKTTTLSACETELAQDVTANDVWNFYLKYFSVAKQTFDSFFVIPKYRTDVTWTTSSPDLFSIPFANPDNNTVKNWLRDNIQDEWKWHDWQLSLNFIDTTDKDTTHVEFVEGATPHVNALAGSVITMDGNRAIDEYSSRWTIRHEYGHVLGFPDCYIEFYDARASVMVSYQIDTENLMCSRRGHLQEIHYDELRRIYFNSMN